MYHALALEDMLDLANVAGSFSEGCPQAGDLLSPRGLRASNKCKWLEDRVASGWRNKLLQRCGVGVAPLPEAALEEYAQRLGFDAAATAPQPVTVRIGREWLISASNIAMLWLYST